MEDLRLIQIWIVATLGGIVGLGFLYLRWAQAGPTVRLWSWAWLSFFVSLLVAPSNGFLADGLAHAMGTGFPVLLLAGALVFAGRRLPAWLIPAGFVIGAFRGLCMHEGFGEVSDALVVLVEGPADWVGAAVLLRSQRPGRRTPIVIAVGALYAVFGVLEITNVRYLASPTPPFSYFALGSVVTLMLALTQLLALLERTHRAHADDLELLRSVAQIGAELHDPSVVAAHSLEALRQRLPLDGAGVWMLRLDTNSLECIQYFGPGEMPEDVASYSERPLPRQVLASGSAIFFDDVQVDTRPMHPWYRDEGFRSGALLPLQEGGESLGILLLGRQRVEPFDAIEQHLLHTFAHELSLALQHASAAARLTAERRVMRAVIDAAPTGILVVDRERRVELLNQTFARHMGDEDADSWLGKRIDSLTQGIAPRFEEPAEFARAFSERTQEEPAFTTPMSLAQPVPRDLLVFSGPILSGAGASLGRVWVTRDVTQENRLQEELRQSQKMETLGTLAGGVAHDFNNQLTAILGNAQLLLRAVADDKEARESLFDLERAAEHCADLTRSLLAFARRAPLTRTILRAQTVVDDATALLRSMLPRTIRFDLDLAEDLPAIRADATQLQQILINLVINARDAVGPNGRITLGVRPCDVGGGRSREAHEAPPGRYLEFRVTDDGAGMDAQTRRRVFDPFFTTKTSSEGTGLGLAVVYGAARAHDGWVEVESDPGAGSTFRVLIPVASEVTAAAVVGDSQSAASQGSETILMADDEPAVRRLGRAMLERSGYRVIEAFDGLEALECFERHRDEIDLLVLDVTMPRLDGLAALAAIREQGSNVPAVLASGLAGVGDDVLEPGRTVFLAKPYDLGTLSRAVRELLDQDPDRS